MLRKGTNSLYENILCLTLKWFTINKSVYTPLSENKEKRAEIFWFGFSSPRGAFRLKTTLHGGGGVLMLMVDTYTFTISLDGNRLKLPFFAKSFNIEKTFMMATP